MRFDKIYYISYHAVDNFKKRLRCPHLTTLEVRNIILKELQNEDFVDWQVYNHKLNPVFKGTYNDTVFYIPIINEINKTNGEIWDVVPTILLKGMKIYTRAKFITLYGAAKKLGIDSTTVKQLIKKGVIKAKPHEKGEEWQIYKISLKGLHYKINKNASKKYTDDERLIIFNNINKSDEYIAGLINRTPNAVRIQRHRMGLIRWKQHKKPM